MLAENESTGNSVVDESIPGERKSIGHSKFERNSLNFEYEYHNKAMEGNELRGGAATLQVSSSCGDAATLRSLKST